MGFLIVFKRKLAKRIYRVHFRNQDESLEGALDGHIDGHYVFLGAKFIQQAGASYDVGSVTVPVQNVLFMQVVEGSR